MTAKVPNDAHIPANAGSHARVRRIHEWIKTPTAINKEKAIRAGAAKAASANEMLEMANRYDRFESPPSSVRQRHG
jgi:hypothetical protein